MKINSFTPVSFGYSKASQRYLDKNIASLEDRQLADTLEKCSLLCNDTEDLIRQNEKKQGIKYSDSYLVDFFVSMKDMLIANVLMLFEDGDKYLQTEHDYYASSLDRCKNKEGNWRRSVLEKIAFWNSDFEEMREKNASSIKEISEKEAKEIIQKSENPAVSPEAADDNPSPLELLEETEFSPKGFSDIMGMKELKEELEESVIKPVNDKKLAQINLEEYGITIPKGILLYGPPGCGKTYIIEALGAETGSPVYLLDIGTSGSKYINQTSVNIKNSLEYLKKEAENSDKPLFLFMDEIDSLCFNRDENVNPENIKQVATLLKGISDVQKHNVIVVGATNKYDLLDPAIRRRFEIKRYVGLPDSDGRIQMLQNNLKNKKKAAKLLFDKEALEDVSRLLEGYSYNSINIIADEASKIAMRKGRQDISFEDFVLAIEKTGEEKADEKEYKTKTKKTKIGFSSLFAMEPKK